MLNISIEHGAIGEREKKKRGEEECREQSRRHYSPLKGRFPHSSSNHLIVPQKKEEKKERKSQKAVQDTWSIAHKSQPHSPLPTIICYFLALFPEHWDSRHKRKEEGKTKREGTTDC